MVNPNIHMLLTSTMSIPTFGVNYSYSYSNWYMYQKHLSINVIKLNGIQYESLKIHLTELMCNHLKEDCRVDNTIIYRTCIVSLYRDLPFSF